MKQFEITEKFEYYFLNDKKYQIDFFEVNVDFNKTERYRDSKFKYFETLKSVFKRKNLIGHPSNTGVNGWARNTIQLNCLEIIWVTNFSYETSTMGFPPRVEVHFEGKEIERYNNINTTTKFIEILNKYNNPSNIVELIESKIGIENCYKRIKERLNTSEILKLFYS